MNAEMDAAELVRDEQNKDEMFRSALERIIQLYTDKAHFIYELLQNAEDAQATTVKFHQMNDCLEVYHDGMPFSLKNLKSLCNIGASDKLGNLNQIGEFGVGFKSVFGICKKVRLYSMPRSCYDAHEALPAFGVEIINFTEPWKTSLEPIPEPYTTKFVFPYCVGESFSGFKTIDVLKRAIAKRLSNLGVTTLLFMRYLRSIEYEINCEGTAGSGRYMLNKKEIKPLYSIVTAMGATIGAKEELSYLKYSKTIPTMMGRTVDIAYPVIIVKDGRYRFQKAKNPPISVYFPTETKSEISLIVQGPYRTTPNRESIPFADEENIMLAELTADLLYESVLDIKAQGQMSLELLNILPLQEPENLDNWLFQPLYEKMIELFQTEAILPTAEEGFVTREHAKLVRGQELIGIFPGGLLGELINDQDYSFDEDENDDIAEEEDHVSYIPYKWLPGELTENNKELSALYSFLKDKLGIEVIKAEDLRKYLNYNRNFLKDRDDAWLEQFYKYLEKVPSLVNRSDAGRNMLSIPFVKTADEDFVVPFRKSGNGLLPNVFMPIKNIGEGFQFVHPLFAEQCNRFFTVILELREPDQYICFKKEIERRYATGLPKATDEEYIDDVKSVLKYLATSEYTGDLLRTLSKLFFIRCEGKVYVNPNNTDVYFDKSNEGVSTKDYFASGDSVRFVDMVFYADNGINRQILQLFGVKDTLIEDWDIESWYCSGEGNTQWCDADDFRSQLDFAGVDSAITLIQNNPKSDLAKKKSKIIMQLLLAVEKHLLGEIIQGKVAQKRVEAQAKIIDVLTCGRRRYYVPKPKWLFDQSGRVVNPAEISKYDLDTDIYGKVKLDSNIYHILGFAHTQKDEIEETLASIACIRDGQAQDLMLDQLLVKYLGLQLSEVKEKLAFVEKYQAGAEGYGNTNDVEEGYFDPDAEDRIYEFPSRPVKNLETLRKSVEGQYFSAPKVKYERREQRIRISYDKEKKRSYLEAMYVCEDNRTLYICQMCKKPWPFFEAVQIEKGPKLELWQMHMLLCPICAEHYRELRNDSSKITDFISKLCEADENQDEPVCVSIGLKTINFTATHIAEIREIKRLNALSKVNDETKTTSHE